MMQKRVLHIMLAGWLLVGLLVGCTTGRDDVAIGGAVKTRFTLSIPNLYGAQTRMSDASVINEASDFAGMQDIRIYPFRSTIKADGEYTISGTTAFTGFTEVSHGEQTNLVPGFGADELLHLNQANDKWFVDLSIPMGTNALLIYGKNRCTQSGPTGDGAATPEEMASGFRNGCTIATFDLKDEGDQPQDLIYISHARVYTEDNLIETREAQLLSALLNQVIGAAGYETADGEEERWANGDNLLSATYDDFVGLRAGNSTHILRVLEALYNACAQTTALGILSAPVGEKTLPEAIQTAITTPVEVSGHRIAAIAEVTAQGNYALTWSQVAPCSDPSFPAGYGLPNGCVQLNYTPSMTEHMPGRFAYASTPTQYGTYALDYRKIVYPSDLWYMTNTSIRTSDSEQDKNVGTQTWEQFIASAYGNDADAREVGVDTKSVAAVKAMQYAVGRLDAYVHIAAGVLYARDPKSPTDDSKQQVVTVPAEGFRITGLLIGGQPSRVGWNLIAPEGGVETVTVYDRVMTQMTGETAAQIGTSNTYARQSSVQAATPFTHTLLFETVGVPDATAPVATETNDEVINLAIEMENNSAQAFYGEDGLIPVGGRFYLIAPLRLSDRKSEANSRGIHSIFVQDHITVAEATIHTLKHAYCTLPNLTVPAQELGISIDLSWKNGVVIDTTIK